MIQLNSASRVNDSADADVGNDFESLTLSGLKCEDILVVKQTETQRHIHLLRREIWHMRAYEKYPPFRRQFPKFSFLLTNCSISIPCSLKFIAKSLMKISPLGDKPLYEPMIAQFTDTYMRHLK